MSQQIWQKAFLDLVKYRKKNFVGNKIDTAVKTFSELEVKNSLLTIKPQGFIVLAGG